MQAWNIKQLRDAMINDLGKCHTDFERTMCRAMCGKEIREKAEEFAKDRKLTPVELAIAQEFGYKG